MRSAPVGTYEHRFSAAEHRSKLAVWREICRHLQRYVPSQATVLELGCDRGYFITQIRAREKWATDIRNVSADLGSDVRFVQADGLALGGVLPHSHFDLVFMSNYLEHLSSADAVVEQLRVVVELLRPAGTALVLQPNIRLVGSAYWDFIDHRVPLTERSLVEAAEIAGLRTRTLVRRFLPYTTKGHLPASPALVRAYLALRPAWWLLGKQTLYVGERVAPATPRGERDLLT